MGQAETNPKDFPRRLTAEAVATAFLPALPSFPWGLVPPSP